MVVCTNINSTRGTNLSLLKQNPNIIKQHLVPHKLISKIADISAHCKITPIKNYLIKRFLKNYHTKLKLDEAIEPNPFAYDSFNSFFTRKLKEELRPIDNSSDSIVSPVDGLLNQFGKISNDKLIQAKNIDYKLDQLVGDESLSKSFIDGDFATIYLAPFHYHRIHMPISGILEKMLYIPGKLFSVNNETAEGIKDLYTKNERVVAIFNTEIGRVAVILVGAMIVGSIETFWHGAVSPPHYKTIQAWDYSSTEENHIKLNKGEEMGLFKLGSTVIMLFEKDFNLNKIIKKLIYLLTNILIIFLFLILHL